MPIVQIKAKPKVKVSVKQEGGRITPVGSGYVTLGNQGAAAATPTSLSALTDVHLVTDPPANGATLVYNSTTNVYDVEILPNVDGGTF